MAVAVVLLVNCLCEQPARPATGSTGVYRCAVCSRVKQQDWQRLGAVCSCAISERSNGATTAAGYDPVLGATALVAAIGGMLTPGAAIAAALGGGFAVEQVERLNKIDCISCISCMGPGTNRDGMLVILRRLLQREAAVIVTLTVLPGTMLTQCGCLLGVCV